MNSMSHRIFIGYPIPTEIQDVLAGYQGKIRRLPIRWLKAKDLHITFLFLGNLIDSELERLNGAVRSIAEEIAPFHITFSKIQAGPPGVTPRLIWVEARMDRSLDKELISLKKMLQDLKIPFKENTRAFHPHLTLGRLNSSGSLKKDHVFYDDLGLAFTVSNLEVLESHLSREGAEYKLVASCILKGKN